MPRWTTNSTCNLQMPQVEPLARRLFWPFILLGVVDRMVVLCVFAFRHVGIDDALIWEVCRDMGNGIFKEPFLYGQNYNPVLEALLGAPFVRLGGHPWVVLPLVTAFLAMLPFWSFALWCRRSHAPFAALVLAAFPLVLPVEWTMITSMPRGFVHGLAILAFVPWIIRIRGTFLRSVLFGFVVATAAVINPNSLIAGLPTLIVWWRMERGSFKWIGGVLLGAIPAITWQWWASHFFDERPWEAIHRLTPAELAFDPGLIWLALGYPSVFFRGLFPFYAEWGALVLVVLIALTVALWYRRERTYAFALVTVVVGTVIALGVIKVHDGCSSIFYPTSRMFLALPLICAVSTAYLFRNAKLQSGTVIAIAVFALLSVGWKAVLLPATIRHELAAQECAFVREEPITVIKERCKRIAAAAERSNAELIAPIRWPNLKVDHRAHFAAHLTCYACPSLLPAFPPSHGIGFDRRSWTKPKTDGTATVLFVGGDPFAWRALDPSLVTDLSVESIQLHAMRCDLHSLDSLVLALGVDNDLGR